MTTVDLSTLLTIDDVAKRLQLSPRRIRALAAVRHTTHGIGYQVPGTAQWLFWPHEVDALRPGKPGRPPAVRPNP
jgi:hypothetical protein